MKEPQKWQKNTKDTEYSLLFPFVPFVVQIKSLWDYPLESRAKILEEIRELK